MKDELKMNTLLFKPINYEISMEKMKKNLEDSIRKAQLEFDDIKKLEVSDSTNRRLFLKRNEIENYKKEYKILTGQNYDEIKKTNI